MKLIIKLFILLIFILANYPVLSNPDDKYWSTEFGIPTTDIVRTTLIDGNYVYYNEFERLVRWNIQTGDYEILGSSGSGSIFTITKHNDEIYIGGTFENFGGTNAKFIAKWTGTKWDTVVSGINAKVNTICFDDDGNIWIGGAFTKIAGRTSKYIAFLKDNQLQEIEDFDREVRCIINSSGQIIAGGDFAHFDSLTNDISTVVKWENNEWHNLGNLGNHPGAKVFSLTSDSDGKVYAGGMFYQADSSEISENVAMFDGNIWNSLGKGLDKMVVALEFHNNKLFAGGTFNNSGEQDCQKIAVFDGSQWQEVDRGMSGDEYPSVWCLYSSDNYLYAGGNFSKSGSIDNWGFVRLNPGNKWENFQPDKRNGTISGVGCFTIDTENDILYAGGGFVKTGRVVSYGIAKFDGNEWIGCNSGLTPTSNACYSMQAVNDTVYFTGWFNFADGIRLRNVAKWLDPQKTWEPVGNGIEGGDFDLGPILVIDSIIYVAGDFKTVENADDTLVVNHITYWNGKRWNQMDGGISKSGTNAPVIKKIVRDDSLIYIIGSFDRAGRGEVHNVAVWNHNTKRWISSDIDINGYVATLYIDDNNFYFGGVFQEAGNLKKLNNIVKWNRTGNKWSRLDSGISGSVSAITQWGDDIYIAGRFRFASGTECNSVAKYLIDEDKFYSLGSGIRYNTGTARVSDLIVYKNELYFGGMFTTAGTNISSSNIAKWSKAPVSVRENPKNEREPSPMKIYPNPFKDRINIDVKLTNTDYISLELFNMSGERKRIIYQGVHINGNSYSFNSQNLTQEVYYIVLKTKNKMYIINLVHMK